MKQLKVSLYTIGIGKHKLSSNLQAITEMNVRWVFIKSQLEIVTEKIHNVMIISDLFDQFTAIDDISVFVSILLPI